MDVEQGRIVSTLGAGDDALAEALTSVSTRLASRRDLPHGRDELVGVVSAAQALVNVATALQDSAIAGLAAVESAWAEDGTLVDLVRGPGHVALDTADLVAPSIGASHAQAQHRVDHAVRLAAGRIPVVDDPREVPRESGLTTLHDAMRDGRLDGYRAGVVAVELAEVPADVAETVVAALDPHLGVEPAPALRRRCRRLLARISPDLLRRRAERARRETGLRRWVAEPGVDAWWGTFPSEDAASAWAAIDELARQYVADGVCPGIDRARAKALTDLVTAHATVTTTVTLTVPAGGHAGLDGRTTDRDRGADDGDLVEVRGLRPSEASLVSRAWVVGHLAPGGPAGAGPVPATLPCDPGSGALLDATVATAYRPPHRLAALVRRRDGRCRFPGCSVAARFCDLDHVRPWPTGPTAADNLACLCRRHHRIKQRAGWRVRMLPGALLEWSRPDRQGAHDPADRRLGRRRPRRPPGLRRRRGDRARYEPDGSGGGRVQQARVRPRAPPGQRLDQPVVPSDRCSGSASGGRDLPHRAGPWSPRRGGRRTETRLRNQSRPEAAQPVARRATLLSPRVPQRRFVDVPV